MINTLLNEFENKKNIFFHLNRMEPSQKKIKTTMSSEDSSKFGVKTNTCRHGSRTVSGDNCNFCKEVS